MARKVPGGTPATLALDRAGVAYTLHPYAHDPRNTHFGDEAAAALGVGRDRILKTLVADVGGELVVAVVPVATQLDLKALAGAAGAKRAVLAEPGVAARTTGYVLGGISPLGQRSRLRTFLDTSVTGFTTVHLSAGKRGLQVELAPDDLVRLTDARLAPLGLPDR